MTRFRGLVLVAWSVLAAWLAVVPVQASEQSVRVVRRAEIYARPTGSATVIAVAQGGQLLEVVVREGDWYQVRVPSTTQVGHIYAPFVEPVTGYAPSSPVVAAQPIAIAQPAMQPAATVTTIPVGAVPASVVTAPGSPLLPFSMGNPILLGPVTEGPVALQTARFRMEKGQLQTEVYATCEKGKDQEVSVTLQLLDDAGTPVATLNLNGGVEEEDDATLKAKANVSAAQLARVRSFALQASTRPD